MQSYDIDTIDVRHLVKLKILIIDDFGQHTFEPAVQKIADHRWPLLGSSPPMAQGVIMLRSTPYVLCIRYAGVQFNLVSDI